MSYYSHISCVKLIFFYFLTQQLFVVINNQFSKITNSEP